MRDEPHGGVGEFVGRGEEIARFGFADREFAVGGLSQKRMKALQGYVCVRDNAKSRPPVRIGHGHNPLMACCIGPQPKNGA